MSTDFQTTIDAVAVCIQAGVPCLLTGPPGCAKTAIIGHLLSTLCDESHTSIAALHEPPEYGGYPFPQPATADAPATVALLPCDWVNRLAHAEHRAGLFLDELNNGPTATRSAAMRGVHEGTWGDVHIPKLSTVAAMNPAELAESATALSGALSNRFCHLTWQMPVSYWVEKMLQGFPPPPVVAVADHWRTGLDRVRAIVAGFAQHMPSAIDSVPADAAARSGPWPSFRSWTAAMELLAAAGSFGHGLPQHQGDISPLARLLVNGCVGPAAGTAFLAYAVDLDLPDPEELLAHPDRLTLPLRGDKIFVILTEVASAVLRQNTTARWSAGVRVLGRAHQLGHGDIAAMAMRALAAPSVAPQTGYPIEAAKAIELFRPLLQAAGMLRGGR